MASPPWPAGKTVEVRLAEGSKEDANGCRVWKWTLRQGYGNMQVNGVLKRAHVVAWEHANGPVPAGKVLDHLCRNRACINVDHLEPVTDKENILRGVGTGAKYARRTHCARGHPLSGSNMYRPKNEPNRRRCRACTKENNDRRRIRA